jgi:hypothetical protein
MRQAFTSMLAAAVLTLVATAGPAEAGRATHMSSPISNDSVYPAGTICDFAYEQSFTGTVTFTQAPNGTFTQVVRVDVTHTNLATGYTLTEHDATHQVIQAASNDLIVTGIIWHLRSPSGKIVLVKAGRGVFDLATGELVSFTPNSSHDQDFAQTLCPLLGGAAA